MAEWRSVSFSQTEVFRTEGADPFQGESEQESGFITDTGIEGHVLNIETAAIPGPTGGCCQINQLAISWGAIELGVSQIVNNGEAAIGTTRRVAYEGGEVKLIPR